MVTLTKTKLSRQRGSLMAEMLVAIAILMSVILPIAYSVTAEKRATIASYDRAVAMEIVDGEMEVLMAGEWRTFTPGSHSYQAHGGALTNLPPGQFTLTIQANKVRLEWQPAIKQHGGAVVREAMVR